MKKLSVGIVGLGGVLVAFLLFGSVGTAHAVAVKFTAPGLISIGGNSYNVASGSVADSLVIGNGSFTVGLNGTSTFTIVSSSVGFSYAGSSASEICANGLLSFTLNGTSTTTVTPQSSACGTGGGSVSPGALVPPPPETPSGGGGGGGIYVPPVVVATSTTSTVATVSTTTTVITGGAATTGTGLPAAFSYPTATYTLTKMLQYGSRGSEVTTLQQMLSQDPSIYPEGTVSGYFGAATRAAVQRFQKKYGIISSGSMYGVVGANTRAKLMQMFGSSSNTAAIQAKIKQLQTLLLKLLQLQAQLKAQQGTQ